MVYKTLLRKQKTEEHASHQITGGELGCFGGVSGSCFKRDTRRLTLVTNKESFGLSIYISKK